MNNLNKQSGFSLIELMVAIAIIGTIATIAIPNYNTFKRRAIQTGAKVSLGGIYASQMTFINEWDLGTQNLEQMGFYMDGETYYKSGWHTSDREGIGVNVNSTTRTAGYNGPLALTVNKVNTRTLGIPFAPGANTRLGNSPFHMPTLGTCECDSCDAGVSCSQRGTTSRCDKVGTGAGTCAYKAGGLNNTNRYNVTFTISAIGNIGGTQYDRWTMDHNKNLVNTQDGTQ